MSHPGVPSIIPSPVTTLCGQLERASERAAAAVTEITGCSSRKHSACSENKEDFPGKLGCLILSSPGAFFLLTETQVPAARAKLFN